jgi:hypothetical protein
MLLIAEGSWARDRIFSSWGLKNKCLPLDELWVEGQGLLPLCGIKRTVFKFKPYCFLAKKDRQVLYFFDTQSSHLPK